MNSICHKGRIVSWFELSVSSSHNNRVVPNGSCPLHVNDMRVYNTRVAGTRDYRLLCLKHYVRIVSISITINY